MTCTQKYQVFNVFYQPLLGTFYGFINVFKSALQYFSVLKSVLADARFSVFAPNSVIKLIKVAEHSFSARFC